MDHCIDAIRSYFEPEYNELLNEWKSKKYKKMSQCPSWPECKVYISCIHMMETYYYGKPMTMTLSSMLRCDSHLN